MPRRARAIPSSTIAGELRLAGSHHDNARSDSPRLRRGTASPILAARAKRDAIPRRSRGLSGVAGSEAKRRHERFAFTLFELILAIALSATLLVLIGSAINLYLVRVDASRSRVEEAQLARSVLAMMAEDLRAAFVYAPQDTSGVADLAANAASFDVDSLDAPSSAGSAGSAGSATSLSSSSTSSASSSSGSSGSGGEPEGVLPLGVHGTLEELIVDIDRLPRLDEPIAVANQSNAAAGTAMADATQTSRISDVKTIRYFVRRGDKVAPSSLAATSLSPAAQARAGGLMRQEIDRAVRTWAEQTGNQSLLETSGLVLVAPEVVHVEFRYFDGADVLDQWDMEEMGGLPLAIEVRIRIASADAPAAQTAMQYGVANLAGTDEYRQTVYLPLSALATGTAGSSSSASDSSTSSSSSDSSGSGSSGSSNSGGSNGGGNGGNTSFSGGTGR